MKELKPEVFTKEFFFNPKYDGGEKDFIHFKGKKLPLRLKKLYNLFNFDPNQRYNILDIGCGKGEFAVFCALNHNNVKVSAIDYSEAAIEIATKNLKDYKRLAERIHFSIGNITNLEFADKSFNVIFVADVFEYLTPEQIKISYLEIKRVLKEEGALLIHTAPNKLFFSFGYPIQRFFLKHKGIIIPKNPRIGVNELYINEPTYFKFKRNLKKAGFKGEIFFSKPGSKSKGLKKFLFHLIYDYFPLKLFFSPSLYCKAQID